LSSVSHFIEDSIKRCEVEEFLSKELERAGFGGVEITKTPLGTRVTIYAMKPGIVIGRHGQSIQDLSRRLEKEFGMNNPQIAVADVEVPEFNPQIMASRIVSALERGIHFRRAGFWALNRIMEAGARGAEITLRGKLTSRRARKEKFRAGHLPKCGQTALKYTRTAVAHVKGKFGLSGVKVRIMPPGVAFPDAIQVLEEAPEPLLEELPANVPSAEDRPTGSSEEEQEAA